MREKMISADELLIEIQRRREQSAIAEKIGQITAQEHRHRTEELSCIGEYVVRMSREVRRGKIT